jgi:hypothetical protein
VKCARKRLAPPTAASLEARVCGLVPAAARDLVGEGVRRLVAYQDATYAQLYLDRLEPVRAADQSAVPADDCCARPRGIAPSTCRLKT